MCMVIFVPMVMKVFQRGDDSHEGVLLDVVDVLEARECTYICAVFNCWSIYTQVADIFTLCIMCCTMSIMFLKP